MLSRQNGRQRILVTLQHFGAGGFTLPQIGLLADLGDVDLVIAEIERLSLAGRDVTFDVIDRCVRYQLQRRSSRMRGQR